MRNHQFRCLCDVYIDIKIWDSWLLTCINEELVGNTRMVHVMDSCGKNGSQDLEIGENSLFRTRRLNDES